MLGNTILVELSPVKVFWGIKNIRESYWHIWKHIIVKKIITWLYGTSAETPRLFMNQSKDENILYDVRKSERK